MNIDVIERVNFNEKYIYNSQGTTLDEKLKPFLEKIISLTNFAENMHNGVN